MKKIHNFYRKIRANIINLKRKIILDMTMSEWDPELPEEKKQTIFLWLMLFLSKLHNLIVLVYKLGDFNTI